MSPLLRHVIVVVWLLSIVLAQANAVVRVGAFSEAAPGTEFPDGWNPLTFPKISRHTSYRLERDGDTVVVKAESEAAASGLTKEVVIDPREFPIVEWRWKVMNLLKKSDVTRKDGDDYPARLYITFAYDPTKVGLLEKAKYEMARLAYGRYPPSGAINYIWESTSPTGTIVVNPYTDRARMIVVESGDERVGRWVTERRNLHEDYRKAFGEEPTTISGVAIMTDTDNTGESAVAYYGDILFKSFPSP